jgi:uncharacterized protein YjbI with pentapeptide repeats
MDDRWHSPEVEHTDPPDARDKTFLARDWTGSEISAADLRSWLLSGGDRRVVGARVHGALDLSGVRVDATLTLARCWIEEGLTADGAQLRALDLSGSRLGTVSAVQLHAEYVRMERAVVRSRVTLRDAELGYVALSGARVDPDAEGLALDADVMTTRRSADFNRDFELWGKARFVGASIGGQLNFSRAILNGPLSLHEVTTARALYLRQGVFLDKVNLSNARIGGRLDATGAVFSNPDGLALDLDGTSVTLSLQLSRSLIVGTVRIRGARLSSSLLLSRAALRGARQSSGLDTVVVDGRTSADAMLDDVGGVVEGRIATARGERPAVVAAKFDSDEPDGVVALRIERSDIAFDVKLVAMTVDGLVRIAGTTIGKRVDARWSTFRNPGGRAVDLSESSIGASLRWRDVRQLEGSLTLRNLRVGRLDDDPASWFAGEIDVRGLTYDTLDVVDRWSVDGRLRWLSRQQPYSPQPYEQLASTLSGAGRREAAWRVLASAADAKRRRGEGRSLANAWGFVKWLTVGHGYHPERAVGLLVALLVAGAVVYGAAGGAHLIRPAGEGAHPPSCVEDRRCFDPILMSIDVGVPVLDLGEQDRWFVDERHGTGYRVFGLAETLLGWALTSAAIAGITRRVVKI